MMVVACNVCGEEAEDNPKEAIGRVHLDSFYTDTGNCGGTFVEMSDDAADLLSRGDITIAEFGTDKDK